MHPSCVNKVKLKQDTKYYAGAQIEWKFTKTGHEQTTAIILVEDIFEIASCYSLNSGDVKVQKYLNDPEAFDYTVAVATSDNTKIYPPP